MLQLDQIRYEIQVSGVICHPDDMDKEVQRRYDALTDKEYTKAVNDIIDFKLHLMMDSVLEANYRNPSFDNGSIQRMVTMNPLIRYIDGREWLLQQAVTGYELFTGMAPDCEAMKAIIKSK